MMQASPAPNTVLTNDPNMHQIHRIGPLSLYELNSQYRLAPSNYATMDASTPDLTLLGGWCLSLTGPKILWNA